MAILKYLTLIESNSFNLVNIDFVSFIDLNLKIKAELKRFTKIKPRKIHNIVYWSALLWPYAQHFFSNQGSKFHTLRLKAKKKTKINKKKDEERKENRKMSILK